MLYFDKITDIPLISVITPTHNRIDKLIECIKSVKNQTYPKIEHIIIGDNCPTLDKNKGLLLSVNPELIIVNLSDVNISYIPARIARARNAGIKLSNGSLVAHLDDDNLWEVDHLSSLFDVVKNENIAVALSQRKLLINGEIPYLFSCHPWSNNIEEGKLVWEQYNRMGIYQKDSEIMSDRISFQEERDITADTNEMLVRKEVHELFPFFESFPEQFIVDDLGEDDVFSMQVYNAGFRVANSGKATLRFNVGGRFTETITREMSYDL